MKYVLIIGVLFSLTACESVDRENLIYGDEASVPAVYAKYETVPVQSRNDAADDPAIWYNNNDPGQSLILATDKKAGLVVYSIDGKFKQFVPAGLPNNVDLRQNIKVGGWSTDLAATSNRAGDVVTLFAVDAAGASIVGEFLAGLTEPYGSCMGHINNQVIVFVTYKTGEVQAHQLIEITGGNVKNNIKQQLLGTIHLRSQLEGCVHDDATGVLYVGEEARGLWRTQITVANGIMTFSDPQLIDEVDGDSGITADIEGVALYKSASNSYVVLSSQGNDSYAVYEHNNENRFVGRFRIANNEKSGIDGSQETDGLEADSRHFGPDFPRGFLVVQDGFNTPASEAQNFKIVDWREIAKALNIE